MDNQQLEIERLRFQNRMLRIDRLCWRDGKRMCDSDRGPNSQCPEFATCILVEDRMAEVCACSEDHLNGVAFGREVKLIGETPDGFKVFIYANFPRENDEDGDQL